MYLPRRTNIETKLLRPVPVTATGGLVWLILINVTDWLRGKKSDSTDWWSGVNPFKTFYTFEQIYKPVLKRYNML